MIYESFPEACFNVNINYLSDYKTRLIVGKQNMSKKHILICGLIRDAEIYFPYISARIEKIGSMFDYYDVFLYENDSKDNTISYLKNWQKNNNRIKFSSEKINKCRHQQDHSLQRRIDMAYYRNQYIDYIQTNKEKYDNIIILDTDLIGGYSYEGLAHSMSFNFDVVASNSVLLINEQNKIKRLYYDSWAFRKLNHTLKHPDEEINNLIFNRAEPPIIVNSAFGGMAIYNGELMKHNSLCYDEKDCDHVTLHDKIRKLGIEIYLNPSQITLYSPTIYTLTH